MRHKRGEIIPIGTRFTRLVVVGAASPQKGKSCSKVRCDCCRDVFAVLNQNLRSRHTESCGCIRCESAAFQGSEYRRTHPNWQEKISPRWRAVAQHGHCSGRKISPTYSSWRSMLGRLNPNHIARKWYREVKVCTRWRDFRNFLADMHERPAGTVLSRHLDSGNYEPGNVSWGSAADSSAERKGKTAAKVWHRRSPVRPETLRNWKKAA
jgi:hypothetical protein